jgi:transcriptional regulator with XRE-family HTH domain
MSEYRLALKEEFQDKEYRDAYADDFLNTFVATQIRVLREERKMKQEDLAQLVGTKQSGISRLENVNYSSWKTDTLRKVARALGVRLRISFETFGNLIDDSARFNPENLMRPKFEDDPAFKKFEIVANDQTPQPPSNNVFNIGDSKGFGLAMAGEGQKTAPSDPGRKPPHVRPVEYAQMAGGPPDEKIVCSVG